MKKIIFIVAMAATLLCGCQVANDDNNGSEYYAEISKAQEIRIVSTNDAAISQKLTTKKDIEDFIDALNIEDWELKTLPEKVEKSGTFAFFQEETVKFGQNKTDGKLHEVCKISVYQDCSYVTFEIAGIKMCFEVAKSSAEYLNTYFI